MISSFLLQGLGRTALTACVLGIIWGLHSLVLLQCLIHSAGFWTVFPLTDRTIQYLSRWCAYVVALCTFHLLEFFVTAIYNPTVLNGDSFLVNHSTAYTTVAITSCIEFNIRFLILGHASWGWVGGLLLVSIGQTLRSLAMATAGQSFHHLIQTSKRDSHVLVTHGIYHYLRHPSYTGFFYWSVGTQVLLGNPLHTLAFAAASWTFFRRRIPYEEETLCRHFPGDYERYRDTTWIGIPFLDYCIRRDRDGSKED